MREKYICTNCGSIFEENETFINKKPKLTTLGCFLGFLLVFIYIVFFIFIGAVANFYIPLIITGILIIFIFLSEIISYNVNNVFSWYNSPFCPYCMNNNCIIPINTPKGQELYNKYHVGENK